MADAVPVNGVSRDGMARLAEQQRWLTPELQTGLQGAISRAVDAAGGDGLRKALNGDWLHEPLHAALSDVPVGAWTATVALDAAGALGGSRQLNQAADAALVVGLVGAVGAAVTGMNDWSQVEKPAARRIGLVHGMLNVVATGIFVASGVARMRNGRSAGRSLAALGYLVVTASAHLGGNLVYEHGIGVAPQAGAVSRDVRG